MFNLRLIDELRQRNHRLALLLADPHPGLASWCDAVAQAWNAIAELRDAYSEEGVSK